MLWECLQYESRHFFSRILTMMALFIHLPVQQMERECECGQQHQKVLNRCPDWTIRWGWWQGSAVCVEDMTNTNSDIYFIKCAKTLKGHIWFHDTYSWLLIPSLLAFKIILIVGSCIVPDHEFSRPIFYDKVFVIYTYLH